MPDFDSAGGLQGSRTIGSRIPISHFRSFNKAVRAEISARHQVIKVGVFFAGARDPFGTFYYPRI